MPGGQPTKLTPELQEAIVTRIRTGAYLETACEAAGIHSTTYRNWLKWGREGKEPYSAFFDAVTRAKAEAELDLLETAKVGDAPGTSNGESKCAQWLLERTRPNKFAQRVNVKVEDAIEALLEDVERVCAGKDCGCLEAIWEAVARRAGGEEAAEPPGPEASPVH